MHIVEKLKTQEGMKLKSLFRILLQLEVVAKIQGGFPLRFLYNYIIICTILYFAL